MSFSIFGSNNPTSTDFLHLPNAFPKGFLSHPPAHQAPSFHPPAANNKSPNISTHPQKSVPSFEMPSGVPFLGKSVSCNQLERKTVLKKENKQNHSGSAKPKFFQHRRVSTNLEAQPSLQRVAPQTSLKSSPQSHKHQQSRGISPIASQKPAPSFFFTFTKKPMRPSKNTISSTQISPCPSELTLHKTISEQNRQSRYSCEQTIKRRLSATRIDRRPSFLKGRGQMRLSDFMVGPCKGSGRFGKVFLAFHRKSGWMVALKRVQKEEVRQILEQFTREVKLQSYLEHSNIVKLYGFFQEQEYVYLVLEYMEEGSLYGCIRGKRGLPEEDVSQKVRHVCQALSFMHHLDILHRDIKPENIVLTHGVAKICDLGWVVWAKSKRKTCCGTLDYTCPQVATGETYSKQIDVWAVGVLAFELLTGKAPFYHKNRDQTMRSIMKCDFEVPAGLSQGANGFVAKVLQREERIGIDQLLVEDFLEEADTSYLF